MENSLSDSAMEKNRRLLKEYGLEQWMRQNPMRALFERHPDQEGLSLLIAAAGQAALNPWLHQYTWVWTGQTPLLWRRKPNMERLLEHAAPTDLAHLLQAVLQTYEGDRLLTQKKWSKELPYFNLLYAHTNPKDIAALLEFLKKIPEIADLLAKKPGLLPTILQCPEPVSCMHIIQQLQALYCQDWLIAQGWVSNPKLYTLLRYTELKKLEKFLHDMNEKYKEPFDHYQQSRLSSALFLARLKQRVSDYSSPPPPKTPVFFQDNILNPLLFSHNPSLFYTIWDTLQGHSLSAWGEDIEQLATIFHAPNLLAISAALEVFKTQAPSAHLFLRAQDLTELFKSADPLHCIQKLLDTPQQNRANADPTGDAGHSIVLSCSDPSAPVVSQAATPLQAPQPAEQPDDHRLSSETP